MATITLEQKWEYQLNQLRGRAVCPDCGKVGLLADAPYIEAAKKGTELIVDLACSDECSHCEGKGYTHHFCDCPHCMEETDECDECDGSGWTGDCRWRKTLPMREAIQLYIPD